MSPGFKILVGMRVRLRKMHPCGNDEWVVSRTGADIGMTCARCGRHVLLDREEFERRVKLVVETPDPSKAAPSTGE